MEPRPTLTIRPATPTDEDAMWEIFHTVVASGDTYVFDPQISKHDALAWLRTPGAHTYVAESAGKIVGLYLLKANQPGLGSHVANAAFMVSPSAYGGGVGKQMGAHCLSEARRLGFEAMQFNFVVSTNEPAVHLWKKLGFEVVGKLPKAFRHSQLGPVDVYVMFRSLKDISAC